MLWTHTASVDYLFIYLMKTSQARRTQSVEMMRKCRKPGSCLPHSETGVWASEGKPLYSQQRGVYDWRPKIRKREITFTSD